MAFALLSRPKRAATVSRMPMHKRSFGPGRRVIDSQPGFERPAFPLLATSPPGAPVVQTKLKIGEPNDKFEQEADRVTEQVMRIPEPQALERAGVSGSTSLNRIQRVCQECEEEFSSRPMAIQRMCPECEEELQRQPMEEEGEEAIQAKGISGRTPEVTPDVQAGINGLRGGGQPLPASTRAFFEPRFGRDFGSVRVHTGGKASALAGVVQARAFTVGNNVVFRANEYMPGTTTGHRLLAHELTHVVQQGRAEQLRSVQHSPGPKSTHSATRQTSGDIVLANEEGSVQRQQVDCNADNNESFPTIDTNSRVRDAVGYAQRKLNLFLRDYDRFRSEAAQINPAAGSFMDRERAKIKPPLAPENADDALDVDCDFGRSTTAATKVFQAATFPRSSPFRAANPEDSAWDGIIGPKTWPRLEVMQPPLRVTIEGFFFPDEHRELLNNRSNWSSSGTKYAQSNPIQVRFSPLIEGFYLGESDPVSLTAESTVTGIAIVNVQSGPPGTELTLTAKPFEGVPGDEVSAWSLSGSRVIGGLGKEFIHLMANAPLPGKISRRRFRLDWTLGVNQPSGEWFALSNHDVFTLAGKPSNLANDDNKPTHKRMRQAVKFGHKADSLRPDKITRQIMIVYPSYGPCDAPTDPQYSTGCPNLSELWELSDYPAGTFQCITIAKYAAAVLNVLGVPSRSETEVKSVVAYTRTENPDVGVESVGGGIPYDKKYCYPGYPAVWINNRPTCPQGPGWTLGLIDGNGRANNFEACTKLKWESPAGRVCQYFCGGAINPTRPLGDYRCPTQILNDVFGKGLWYQVTPYDPSNAWPKADLKKKVRSYSGKVDPCSKSSLDQWCK